MIVKLKRYVIESTRSVSGKVISNRYGYVISIWYWRTFWRKPRYLNLLSGWQHAILHDENVRVQLVKYIGSATPFDEDGSVNFSRKSTAENIIKLLKTKPEMFILS